MLFAQLTVGVYVGCVRCMVLIMGLLSIESVRYRVHTVHQLHFHFASGYDVHGGAGTFTIEQPEDDIERWSLVMDQVVDHVMSRDAIVIRKYLGGLKQRLKSLRTVKCGVIVEGAATRIWAIKEKMMEG